MNVHTFISLTLYLRRGSRGISDRYSCETPTIYIGKSWVIVLYLAMKNTADVIGGKPIGV
jgi:hypothetical protein